jgi:hypothetical protein
LAPYALKCYLLPSVLRVELAHKDYRLDIHVDDFFGAVTDKTVGDAVGKCYAGALAIKLEMADVGLDFGKDKNAVLGSSARVEQSMRRSFGGVAGHPTRSVRRLGVDHVLNTKARGLSGSRWVQKARIAKGMRRCARLAALKHHLKGKHKQMAHAVFKSAVRSVIGFGAEIVGIMPSARRCIAAQQLRYTGYATKCASDTLTWAAVRGLGHPNPEIQLAAAPLLRYARGWWLGNLVGCTRPLDVLDPITLATVFGVERAYFDRRLSADAEVPWSELQHHPVRWALAVAGLCGWTPISARVFRRPNGITLDLGEIPEVVLSAVVADDYEQYLIGQTLRRSTEWRLDYNPRGLWIEPLHSALRSKARTSMSFAHKRLCVRAFATGVWTGEMLHHLGYSTNGLCPNC